MCAAIFPSGSRRISRRAFGAGAADEGRALAERAPVDLRANLLKDDAREGAWQRSLTLSPQPTPLSPVGLRIAIRPDGRGPALAAEPAYVKGLVEVQDEGSQLAALLAEAKPGMQVLDLCAGAGGKTLALAGAMRTTTARSMRPTPTADGLRRSSTGSRVRAPATSRCARRGARPTCSPTSPDAATS